MKKISFAIVFSLVLFVSACQTAQTNPSVSSVLENKMVTYAQLHNTQFKLQTVNGQAVTGINEEKQPRIAFDGKDHLNGMMCNGFFGAYTLENNVLKSQVTSTLMLCVKEDLNRAEQSLFKLLSEGAQIQLTADTLTLKDDTTTFVFEK